MMASLAQQPVSLGGFTSKCIPRGKKKFKKSNMITEVVSLVIFLFDCNDPVLPRKYGQLWMMDELRLTHWQS